MARFERQDTNPESASPTVATATDELRSTVEQQLRKIVEAAEARAGEIESQALDRASRIERESEQRAREAFQAAIDRAYSLLTAIESMERELRSVRNETETLVAELEASSAASGRLSEPPQGEPPTDEDSDEGVDEELNALATADETVPDEPDAETTSSPEVREMIREQLLEIRDSGKPRADAERFLMRFTQGERHLDLLDQIYAEGEEGKPSTSRRRRLRRRRSREQHANGDAAE